jgi:hypothetical protein
MEAAPSLFQSLVFGLSDDWFGDGGECLRSAEGWRSLSTRMGLSPLCAELAVEGGDVAVAIHAQASDAAQDSGDDRVHVGSHHRVRGAEA